jgi:D-alanine-D-alanine ligase
LKRLTSEKKGITVMIGSFTARTNAGRVPDHGTVTVTACFTSRNQGAELDREVRRIAEKGTDGALQVQVRFGARRPPVAATKANKGFFEMAQELAKKQEVRIERVHRDFPADICHVPENIPVLGGFGPLGGEVRSQNEYIVRDSLIDRSALLATVIFSVSKRRDKPAK